MLFFRKHKSDESQRGKQSKRTCQQATLSRLRRLRCEPLEDRRLLSIGYGPSIETYLPPTQIQSSCAASVAESSAAPNGVDLIAKSDTGLSDSDDLTNLDNSTPEKSLQFEVSGTIAGAIVTIYADNIAIGSTQATDTTTIVTTDGSYDITDGTRTITARQTEVGNTESENAPPLNVTIDTVASSWQSGYIAAKLLATDGLESDWFGHSVSISGATAIVGVAGSDDNGKNSGSAYIFEQTDTGWEQVAKLLPSYGAAYDNFGKCVSISSTTAIVGMPGDDNDKGSAYIFEQTDIGWERVAKLSASDSAEYGRFGCSVSLCGTTAIVGAHEDPGHDEGLGAAYVFQHTASGWEQIVKLTADDGEKGDRFGVSVSVSGTTAIVGANLENANGNKSGSAYVFEQTNAGWQQVAKLTPADGNAYSWFGCSVSISGNTTIIGAHGSDGNDNDSGSAYIFQRTPTGWEQVAKLIADDGATKDYFGSSVSIHDTAAIVGALYNDNNASNSGAAYIFTQTDTGWKQTTKLTANDGAANDGFGGSVAISGTAAMVGMPNDDDKAENSGAAYVCSSVPIIDLQSVSDSGPSDSDNITSNTAPSFDVAATPYYRVYRDGVQISGDYETAPSYTSDALLDGTYEFTVRAVDEAGNESQESTILSVNIDTIASSVAGIVPDLRTDSDLGQSDTDNLTCDNTPSFDVPGTPYYRFFLNGTEVGSGPQSGVFTLLELPDGTYDVSVIAIDLAGNESVTTGDSLSITIETVVPSPPVVAPVLQAASDTGLCDSDNTTNDNTPTFDIVAPGYYRLYRNDVLVCDYETANSITLPPQPDGAHEYTIVTVDEAGNESLPSPALNVTIDTLLPLQTDFISTKLLASDGQEDDYFGRSVSICGTTAIVGAFKDDGSGTAYVYEQTDAGWQEVAKLVPSDGAARDYFGRDVAINGTTAIVGAYGNDDHGENSGSAYIFEQTDTGWLQVAKLTAADGAASDYFGCSVAVNGTTAIIGASGDSAVGKNSGSAYIFEQTDTGWQQVTKLTAPDGVSQDYFGKAVSISGNIAIVSAICDDNINGEDSGSAYIFKRNDTGWEQIAKLTADDGATQDYFGYSVSISGCTAIVGAKHDDDRGNNSGSVYFFEETGGDWQQAAKLTADDGAAGDMFGYNVCIDGDAAIVGALRADISGSAYLFKRTENTWHQIGKQTNDNGASWTYFGESVSISGSTCIVGACEDSDHGDNSGSASIFTSRPTINLQAACDSGISDTDNITSNTTLTFDIAATPYYRLYCDGVLVSDLYANSPHFTMSELLDGTYEFTVLTVDGAGNESIPSATLTVTIDTVGSNITGILPDLEDGSDTGISNTDNLTNDNTPSFSVPGVPCYRIFLDGTEIGDGLQSGSFTFPTLDDGTYEIAVIAADKAGNEAAIMSDPISVTIDTAAPDIAGVLPDLETDSDTGISSTDNLTNDTTPSFSVPGGPYYRVFLDGTEISNGLQSGSFTLPALDDGTYEIAIIVADEAGNEAETVSDSISVTIDTTAPDAPTAAPDLQAASDTGLYDSDNVTNDTTPTFDVTAPGYYRVYRDGILESNSYETADSYTCTSLPLTDGTYDYTIIHVDEAGNESIPSPALGVTIDTVAPTRSNDFITKLLDNNGEAADQFGYSVAISDTIAVVGARYDDAEGIKSGSAFIFEQTACGWEKVDKLIPRDSANCDYFGHSVAISGTTVIVGAYGDSVYGSCTGSAYIFELTDNGWKEVDKLIASDGARHDYFGYNVAISGTRAIVGAYKSCSAYIFEQTDSGWEEVEKISDLGSNVAISGTTVLVGTSVFEETHNGWEEVAKLTASDGYLGGGLAISGNVAIVGAGYKDSNGSYSGAAYVFERTPDGWEETAKLIASDSEPGDYFGHSVAISGSAIIVGAYGNDDNGDLSGSAYLFQRTSAGWEEVHKLIASDTMADNYFGCSVAISGATIIVGACDENVMSDSLNSAYIFTGLPLALQADSDTGACNIDNITNDNTPTFDVTVHSYTPYYRIYRNDFQVSGDYETAGSFTSEALLDGTYEFTIRAFDEVGNEILPGFTQSVTIDTIAPSISGIMPDLQKESDLGLSDSDNLTCDNTPTFEVPGTSYYRFFLNGTEISSGYQSGSFTLLTQPDGTHSLAVVAVDAAGNESDLGNPMSITIDTVAPSAPTIAPDLQASSDSGLSDSDNITNDNMPSFDIATSGYYRLYRDGILISDNYETASNYTAQQLPDGTYDYAIVAVDEAGNESLSSPVLHVTIDTIAPLLSDDRMKKLLANDCSPSGSFGYSVAISGTTAIVGTYRKRSAHIFELTPVGWEEVTKLTASDGSELDYFGYSVSISGNTVIVGAYRSSNGGLSAGAAYVFERTATGWEQIDKLTASDAEAHNEFGYSVAISGTTAVVGAWHNSDNGIGSGSAYVFERTATGWEQVDNLIASDGASGDGFGSSVAINGTTAIIGASGNDGNGTDSGAAYIFERDVTGWEQVDKLNASDAAEHDNFGASVAIDGVIAIIGAREDDDNGNCSGSAYVFERTVTGWEQVDKLTASDAAKNDFFGASVAINGTTALIGAYGDDDNGSCSGSAYLFERTAIGWEQVDKLTANNGAASDFFGASVAISDHVVIIGATENDYQGKKTGSAYAFSTLPHIDLQVTSDWGISDTDNITCSTMPIFDIAATPHYRVYRDGVQVSNDYETGSSYISEKLSEGVYEFTVSAIDAAGNETLPSVPLTVTIETCSIMPGDANEDGKVDGYDGAIFAANWQAGVNDGRIATWSMGDFNRDGKVDRSDLTIFHNSWRADIDSTGIGEEPGQTATHFVPPVNASLGKATVPRRESLSPRRLITPVPTAAYAATDAASRDAALAESTWSSSDVTAIAKDLTPVSVKKSTAASDELFALELDPYGDLE